MEGKEGGDIFHLDMPQLSSLSLLRVNQCAVCLRSERGEEELLFIFYHCISDSTVDCIFTRDLYLQRGRGSGAKLTAPRKVQFLFSARRAGSLKGKKETGW